MSAVSGPVVVNGKTYDGDTLVGTRTTHRGERLTLHRLRGGSAVSCCGFLTDRSTHPLAYAVPHLADIRPCSRCFPKENR